MSLPSEEQWRPVPGFEDYEVSDQGRVRSLPRTITRRDGFHRAVHGGVLSAFSRGGGRATVTLFGEGRSARRYVHQLVLEAFVGPRPAPEMEACHNDGDNSNNRLSNLRWDTKSANQRDAVLHGVHAQTSRTHCVNGHPLAGDNLRTHIKGGTLRRQCLTCRRADSRRYKERLRLADLPTPASEAGDAR